MGEVIQLQGDQRKDVQEFLVDKSEGLELDLKTIKVSRDFSSALNLPRWERDTSDKLPGPRFLGPIATPRRAVARSFAMELRWKFL